MRYSEIIAAESYSDETATAAIKNLDADTYLTVGRYADEQADLMRTYVIDASDTLDAVRQYTRASTINAALRSGKPLGTRLARQFHRLMDLRDLGCALPEAHHVYSGLGEHHPGDFQRGDHYVSHGFISASLSLAVATKTNNFRRKGDTDYLFHFDLPKGYQGCFYLGSYSTDPAELEMLIFPDEPFVFQGERHIRIGDVDRILLHLTPASLQ